MPELPDITVYLDALRAHVVGQRLQRVRLRSSFVLRSVDPPLARLDDLIVARAERLGKRIVLAFPGDLFLVIHLMIGGRLRWRPLPQTTPKPPAIPVKIVLATFEFPNGALVLTEAGSKKRAWIRVVHGLTDLAALDPGGLDPLEATPAAFHEALVRENHTLKRALTDPRLFSGIGNAYSDEILHAARLSPVTLTRRLSDEEALRLYDATRATLLVWIDHLRREAAGGFPEKVTAFHDAMAVHGRFKQPCPVCGAPVQRIVYAENECNYCARCQTGGKLLADRSLSRLLKGDWPRSIDESDRRN
jgi:formamidopyrimidine-DNA glycosylase